MAVLKRQYVARIPLEYPTDPAIIKQLAAGEAVPYAQRGHKRVEAGEIVTDLPRESVPVLLKKGWIEEVREPADEAAAAEKEVA